MKRRTSSNPKRRILEAGDGVVSRQGLLKLLGVQDTGNPGHKRNPGDFGLTPPTAPRAGKTLCDAVAIHSRSQARRLLEEGIRRGLISVQCRDGFPQNIWAVTGNGEPLEAQHEGNGRYHGYPMPEADPFREEVLAHWSQ